jgi:hypothetical protein
MQGASHLVWCYLLDFLALIIDPLRILKDVAYTSALNTAAWLALIIDPLRILKER